MSSELICCNAAVLIDSATLLPVLDSKVNSMIVLNGLKVLSSTLFPGCLSQSHPQFHKSSVRGNALSEVARSSVQEMIVSCSCRSF